MWSLPLWECGLKLRRTDCISTSISVTPLVGVWIEIVSISQGCVSDSVTPLVGVWIEIV